MAKFCFQCGNQLPDDALFCDKCGTPTTPAAAPVEAPVQAAPQYSYNYAEQPAPVAPAPAPVQAVSAHPEGSQKPNDGIQKAIDHLKANPKKFYIGIGAIAAVLVVVILLTSLIGGGKGSVSTWQGALDNTISAMKGDAGAIKKMAPSQVWDSMSSQYGISSKDMDSYFSMMASSLKSSMASQYGKNFKITYTTENKTAISSEDLAMISFILKEDYNIKSKVSAGYTVDVTLTIKGSQGQDTDAEEMTFIKIGNSWYIVDYSPYYESVDFLGF